MSSGRVAPPIDASHTQVLPGGFAFTFTGMRVTGHDGQAQQHLIGVLPDIPFEPTIAGIRAGRDELLKRAVTFIRAQK